jgi:hypothetical protein
MQTSFMSESIEQMGGQVNLTYLVSAAATSGNRISANNVSTTLIVLGGASHCNIAVESWYGVFTSANDAAHADVTLHTTNWFTTVNEMRCGTVR